MRHRDIFLAALDLAAADRIAYLDRACADDGELRRLVEELLLSHDEAGSFLEHPAFTDETRTVGEGVATPGEAAEAGTVTEAGAAADDFSFLAPSPAPDCLGRLGYYDVRGVVGRGGMGVVLKAVDTKLQRVVAIKVLAPALAASGTARQRFLREAHAAAAVRDDHVVGIYGVGDEGPVPYLVMEYIGGITLDDRIKQGGPLEVKEVLRIGMQVARGLAAAHAQGLIHRDIKPANILLENGVQRVKITDFGLARAADDASLTQSGVIAGTPMYMSPEQAEGKAVDPRTDLFSLGSVLYAMCTGRPPFRADSTMAVLKRVCEEAPRPIREVNPDIPDWLAAIVMKLLAKDPAQRFQSAAEVADLLGQYLAHVQQPHLVARPAPVAVTAEAPRRRRRPELRGVARVLMRVAPGCLAATLMLVALVLFVFVVGLIVVEFYGELSRRGGGNQAAPGGGRVEVDQPPRPLTPEERAKLPSPIDGRKRDDIRPDLLALAGGGNPVQAPPELVAVLGDGRFVLPGEGLTSWMAPSPDGKLLAVPRGSNVVLFDAGTGAVVRTLVGRAIRAYGAAFSPDGTRLASGSTFHGDGAITVWDVQSGQVVHVLKGHTGDVWRTAFSGDGKRLVSGSADKTAKVWDVEKGVELFTLPGHQDTVYAVVFSPDGRSVLTGSNDGTVKVWDARTGQERKTLRVNGDNVWSLVYSPDRKLLACGCWRGWKLWDAKTFEAVRSGAETAAWLAFSADSHVLLTGRHGNLDGATHAVTRWDVASGDKLGTLSLKSAGGWAFYALSPDTKTLFAMGGDPPDPFVRSYDAETGQELFPRQGHEGHVLGVAVSRDGKLLASGGDDRLVRVWNLAEWNKNEALPPVRTFAGHTDVVWCVAFSPDGKFLASSSRDHTITLWDVEGGRDAQTLPGAAGVAVRMAFSPDGQSLVAGCEDGGVRSWKLPGDKEGVLLCRHAARVRCVAFSPDGTLMASGGEDRQVWVCDVRTTRRLHAFTLPSFVNNLEFSPDGRTLAATSDAPDSAVHLWDVADWKEVRLPGHTHHVHGLAFSPIAPLLATASHDGTLRFWDLSSSALARGEAKRDAPHVLTIGPGPLGSVVYQVAFTPEGRYLVTSNGNGTISILRTPNGRPTP